MSEEPVPLERPPAEPLSEWPLAPERLEIEGFVYEPENLARIRQWQADKDIVIVDANGVLCDGEGERVGLLAEGGLRTLRARGYTLVLLTNAVMESGTASLLERKGFLNYFSLTLFRENWSCLTPKEGKAWSELEKPGDIRLDREREEMMKAAIESAPWLTQKEKENQTGNDFRPDHKFPYALFEKAAIIDDDVGPERVQFKVSDSYSRYPAVRPSNLDVERDLDRPPYFSRRLVVELEKQLPPPVESSRSFSSTEIGDLSAEYSGPPVRDSRVRLEQERLICQALKRAGKPVILRGSRRIGATSFLQSFGLHWYGSKNYLFVDLQRRGPKKREGFEAFRARFGLDLVAVFIAGKEVGPEYEREMRRIRESSQTPLEYLNGYLNERSSEALLIIDEAIALRDFPGGYQYLSSLRNLGNLDLLISLHRDPENEALLGKTFADFEAQIIGPLSLNETALLIQQPLVGTPVSFTDEAARQIYQLTGGGPFVVNNLCEYLLRQHPQLTYAGEDVTELIANRNIRQLRWDLEKVFEFYEDCLKRLGTSQEREIIVRLAQQGGIPFSEIDTESIQGLVDYGFVRRDRAGGVYRVNDLLFERAIKEKAIDLGAAIQ
jgi:hypothetical protein